MKSEQFYPNFQKFHDGSVQLNSCLDAFKQSNFWLLIYGTTIIFHVHVSHEVLNVKKSEDSQLSAKSDPLKNMFWTRFAKKGILFFQDDLSI